eukprot:TRINITY_DN26029_c0_g1_i1.p1 TRINITY_DN26029_c0_g1~~TRINITY_DN26029_c0_g1_i1.p1  ORF type:complete len:367 (+),score=40.75 TRINITY_DN26029_c0_g1_i1:29-1129(+)
MSANVVQVGTTRWQRYVTAKGTVCLVPEGLEDPNHVWIEVRLQGSGRPYYHHRVSGVTRWVLPEIALPPHLRHYPDHPDRTNRTSPPETCPIDAMTTEAVNAETATGTTGAVPVGVTGGEAHAELPAEFPQETYVPTLMPSDPDVFLHPSLRVCKVPGKGNGYFAVAAIPAGETLVRCRPLGVADTAERVVLQALRTVSADTQRLVPYLMLEVLRLAGATREEKAPEWLLSDSQELLPALSGNQVRRLLAVVETNAFGIGEDLEGLFPLGSYFNHSCRPNCQWTTRKPASRSFHQLTVWTREAVPAGSELTISYVPDEAAVPVIRRKLERAWGFTCRCPVCSNWPSKEYLQRLASFLAPNEKVPQL